MPIDAGHGSAARGLSGSWMISTGPLPTSNALSASPSRSGLKVEESQLRFLRGNLWFPRGDVESCLRQHRRTLELAREAGAAECEAEALGGLGDAEYARGHMPSARR